VYAVLSVWLRLTSAAAAGQFPAPIGATRQNVADILVVGSRERIFDVVIVVSVVFSDVRGESQYSICGRSFVDKRFALRSLFIKVGEQLYFLSAFR